jgi:serine/threonine-protein kinase
VKVPSVKGKTRDDAISTLVNAGLKPKVFQVPSSLPVDTVTGQDPAGGQTVVKGSPVRINVSSGPAEVSVPSVIGLSYDQALTQLQNDGFAVARKNVDSNQPKNTVVDESPSGSAPKGATITLSVSKGPKTSGVPDVTSQDQTSAQDTLTSAGFKVKVQKQTVTDPGLDGIVLQQDPRGGTQEPKGTTVTITVGQFPQPGSPPPPVP